jgi:TetR/AcrR family transcriptional regulator, tetracycline repressor protein
MPLSRDEVLAGALRLLDEVGLRALTMRRLADILDVQAGAIYWHFANKQALVDAMVDSLFAGMFERPMKGPWDRQLAEICRQLAEALLRHRDGAPLAAASVSPGPNALAVSEAMLRITSQAGLSKETTLWATAVLGYYVLGYVTDVQAMQAAKARGIGPTLKALKKQLATKQYPELSSLGKGGFEQLITGIAFRKRFEFGLEVILAGLKAHRRLTKTTAKTSKRTKRRSGAAAR